MLRDYASTRPLLSVRPPVSAPRSRVCTGAPGMVLEHVIDHCPCGFHCILAGKQRSVAFHCVAQQPFVGRFFSRLLFRSDKALAALR